jgi:hypothetical protein
MSALRHFWSQLFPLPSVGTLEYFLARAGFAFALMAFFPWDMVQTLQPKEVGLAHWFTLTWLADDASFHSVKAVFCALLVCYGAGLALPITLPLLALIQLLPYTLLNSQGSPHHGYQILSLPLCAIALLAAARPRSTGSSAQQVTRLVAALALGYGWHRWLLSYSRASLAQWAVDTAGTTAAGYLMLGLELAVFTLICWLPRATAAHSGFASRHLFIIQWTIAATYFVSVCSKMIMSSGAWFARSHFIVLDMVKATRQSYYSALEPSLKTDPPFVQFFMEHQQLTRLFFSSGVLLELILILAVGSRRLALLLGISLIAMHRSIEALMTLNFHTNEAMLLVFFVNLPYWLSPRSAIQAQ